MINSTYPPSVLLGYIGRELLEVAVVSIGADGNVPNPLHLRQTEGKSPAITIAQSQNGWMTHQIKRAVFEGWVKSGKTKLGKSPTVMGADGHKSNSEQVELSELTHSAKCFFYIIPAHTSAKGLAQLDLRNGLIMRFKKAFRRLMRKQFNASMSSSVPEGQRGRLTYSTVLRLVQLAAEESASPMDQLRDNERVGFYINGNGLLDLDPFRSLAPSFFQTSLAFGGSGANSELITMDSRAREIQDGVDQARAEVAAVAGAITAFEVPPVPHDAAGRIGRSTKSLTTSGAVVSSPTYRAFLAEKAAKSESDARAKVDKLARKVRLPTLFVKLRVPTAKIKITGARVQEEVGSAHQRSRGGAC